MLPPLAGRIRFRGSKANLMPDSSVFLINEAEAFRISNLGFGFSPQFRNPESAIRNPCNYAIQWMNPECSSYQKTSTGYLEKFLSGETRVDPVSFAWTIKIRSKGSLCTNGSRESP